MVKDLSRIQFPSQVHTHVLYIKQILVLFSGVTLLQSIADTVLYTLQVELIFDPTREPQALHPKATEYFHKTSAKSGGGKTNELLYSKHSYIESHHRPTVGWSHCWEHCIEAVRHYPPCYWLHSSVVVPLPCLTDSPSEWKNFSHMSPCLKARGAAPQTKIEHVLCTISKLSTMFLHILIHNSRTTWLTNYLQTILIKNFSEVLTFK